MKRFFLRRGFWVTAIILAILGAGVATLRFSFLAQTKAALLKGELPSRGSLGKVMSPKAGCLYLVDAIDDRTFEAFLSRSTDTEAREFVISLLGWKHRSGSLDYLKSLAASGGEQSQHATLSVSVMGTASSRRGGGDGSVGRWNSFERVVAVGSGLRNGNNCWKRIGGAG